jgi:hypothetical protein
MEKFHDNFPSFEKQFEQLEDEQFKDKQIKDELQQKTEFIKFLPNVEWSRLQKQRSNCLTDDNSTHFLDSQTNEIYSWNYLKKTWKNQKDFPKTNTLFLGF